MGEALSRDQPHESHTYWYLRYCGVEVALLGMSPSPSRFPCDKYLCVFMVIDLTLVSSPGRRWSWRNVLISHNPGWAPVPSCHCSEWLCPSLTTGFSGRCPRPGEECCTEYRLLPQLLSRTVPPLHPLPPRFIAHFHSCPHYLLCPPL